MRILVNGNTITEMVCDKIVRIREFKRNEIIECDFNQDDMKTVEKAIDHIKRNRVMYTRLVFMTALLLNCSTTFIFANELGASLDEVGTLLVGMLLDVAKWGCIGMGLRNMIITLINGGNMKQAMTEGIQYWIGYLFIQFYPQLFDLFSNIKF